MHEKEFNLIREQWILVMKPDGEVHEVSLIEVFSCAQEFQCLAGELPTQDVAVMRFLLAILHSVFSRYNASGTFAPIYNDETEERVPSPKDALDRWRELWELDSFPMKIIEEYLAHYEDRFYLFHPEYPIYQVAELERSPDQNFGPFKVSKMNGEILESSNKVRLFSQRAGEKKELLSFPEATRWLLYLHGYAETFGKLESRGKTDKNKMTIGVGWLGQLGLVYARGENLFKTLMLNLVLLKDKNTPWGIEKPVWESEQVLSVERHEISIPDNLSELYTLQSRRLLLHKKNGCVSEYSFRSGDFFSSINALSEPMTVWKKLEKVNEIEFQPKKHELSRQFWRDFSGFISQSDNPSQETPRPGVLNWLSYLSDMSFISTKSIFHIHALGVRYGNMSSSVVDIFYDNISFNSGLLTTMGRPWMNRVIAEIETTEKLVQKVGRLSQNIEKASGQREGLNQYNLAKEQAYYLLDVPFRRWLAGIDPANEDMSSVCDVWWQQEKRIIREMGKRMIMDASSCAFVGREVKEKVRGKELTQHYSTPEAYNSFLYWTSTRERLKGGK